MGGPAAFTLSFVLAARRYLRRGIHNTWDNVMVHVPGLAGDNFRDRDTLVLGLVREHRARDHVADGLDALHIGRKMRVDLDAAVIIYRDACFLQPEAFVIRQPADTYI